MPASENKYETGFYINCLLSCFRNILIAILCLLVASLSFGWAIQKYGYFKYYKFIPGEYTGYRLHQLSILVPEKTCLLLGSSTAREAFDIEKLEERFPTLNFVTLATTGPYNSSTIIDIQASIIPKNQYACIIVGTHPFSIFTPDNTSYQLRENNYFSQIPFFELLRMIRFDGNISIQELKFLISIVLMPNRRHSAILYAHLESATREMKTLIDEGRIFNIRSSHFTNQMKDKSTFHLRYKDERSKKMRLFIEKRRKQIALNDLENPKRYSSAATNGALTASIKKLDQLTNRLIVLDLPEPPVG